MEFESRFWRNLISKIFSSFLPDIIVSLVITWYFKEGMVWAVFIFLGLQALYIVVWAIRSMFAWAWFFIGGRKRGTANLCDFLYRNKFPAPSDYEKSVDIYLNDTAENDDLDIKVRIKAAYELGTLASLRSSLMQNYLMVTMTFEDAMEEYKRDLLRKGVVDTD